MPESERSYGFRGGWELPHHYGEKVHVLNSPYLRSILARLGGNDIRHPEINESLRLIYRDLMIQVAGRELEKIRAEVPTRMVATEPRAVYRGEILDPSQRVVVVSIIRAGIIPAQTCFDMLNLALEPANVRLDHLMMSRTTDESGRVSGVSFTGSKVGGPIDGRTLLLPDPMGATGSTVLRAAAYYRENFGEPRRIVALPMIATPEFLRHVREHLPECVVYTARIDRGLSEADVLETLPGTRWAEERGLRRARLHHPWRGRVGRGAEQLMVLRSLVTFAVLCASAIAQGQDLAKLEKRLESHDSDERSAAVRELSARSEPKALELLIGAIDDESAYVRDLVLQQLVRRCSRPELVEQVFPAFSKLERSGRLVWCFGVSCWRAPFPLEPVLGASGDKEARVREAALLGLSTVLRRAYATESLRPDGAPLRGRAADEAALLRQNAEIMRKEISIGPWQKALLPRMRDKDRYVRAAAVELVALGPEKAQERLLAKAAKDREACVRLALLSGLGTSDPSAARCVAALKDEAWQVRVEALEQLGRLAKSAAEIDALLGALERKEEASPVLRAASASLTVATRMRFGERAEDWRRWWEDVRDDWKPPPERKEDKRPRAEAGETSVSWHGLPIDAKNVVFVIDNSGSMRDALPGPSGERPTTKRDLVERELERVVEALPDRVAANVVLFADEFERWQDGVRPLKKKDRKEILAWVRARPPRGKTNLLAGVLAALEDPRVEAVYLLSDGAPSVGEQIFREWVAARIRERNRLAKVRLHTAAILARPSDEAEARRVERHRVFLERLALANGGRAVEAK